LFNTEARLNNAEAALRNKITSLQTHVDLNRCERCGSLMYDGHLFNDSQEVLSEAQQSTKVGNALQRYRETVLQHNLDLLRTLVERMEARSSSRGVETGQCFVAERRMITSGSGGLAILMKATRWELQNSVEDYLAFHVQSGSPTYHEM
jgi:hypothetical protein